MTSCTAGTVHKRRFYDVIKGRLQHTKIIVLLKGVDLALGAEHLRRLCWREFYSLLFFLSWANLGSSGGDGRYKE